eukprot:CAMPEP_0172550230 /NCGR_PEP_ID=MMETSP1067-20121228/27243_1 /TAXON_ID=265564 ORGANISM="Thalassiosira punctigera, Strain Tpunct2005C2" /NCGR_SAMPLE_ID=MMETSP1067 /ASSEMBLY_ACC=CAM_ASM_000444 /LENGTH=30 /DNA_ID= /DNA_START= /DNA_END= /DNA_ORIENTATION=
MAPRNQEDTDSGEKPPTMRRSDSESSFVSV